MNKYFPERLGSVYLINYPWALSIVLSLVEPMLDPDTRKKINLVKKKEDLLNIFDKEHLLPIHGGSSSYNNNQRFLLGFETINHEFAESVEILANWKNKIIVLEIFIFPIRVGRLFLTPFDISIDGRHVPTRNYKGPVTTVLSFANKWSC